MPDLKNLLALLLVASLPLSAMAQAVPQSRAEISLSFAPLVRQASPAVVNIYVRQVVQGRDSPFAGDPFFDRLFGGLGQVAPRVQNSLGSGVILTASGLVVSNYHVVAEATDIRVVLADRREFVARVVMADEATDLAVLRLDGAEGLPTLPLRDSDDVEVGELVLAIGNPFGVGQTVSSGIVSALARSAASLGRGSFIQTDAPINPGNSGGALIDMAGRLIGVNTAILSRSGGSNGIGFAIPANLVAEVLRQTEAGRDTFLRPWAGLGGQVVDAQIADALGLDRPGGIMITDVHPQSPFGAAGVQPGDVILTLDGAEVNSPEEILYRLSVAGIGQQVRLTYLHEGRVRAADVRLAAAPQAPDRDALTITQGGLAGLTVASIDPALIEEMNLPLQAVGVVVTAIEGVLIRSGLAVGDVVLGINGEAVGDARDVARLAASGGRSWAFEVLRQGQLIRLRFRL